MIIINSYLVKTWYAFIYRIPGISHGWAKLRWGCFAGCILAAVQQEYVRDTNDRIKPEIRNKYV